jgi:hypothetical protein
MTLCIYGDRDFVFGFKQFRNGTKNFHIDKVAAASRGEAENGKFFHHNTTFLSSVTSNTVCSFTDGVSLMHASVGMHKQTLRPHKNRFHFGVIPSLFLVLSQNLRE